MPLYATYSTQAVTQNGSYFIYRRADGSEVAVTNVSQQPNSSEYHWPDKEDRGEVERFVREVITDRSRWEQLRPQVLK